MEWKRGKDDFGKVGGFETSDFGLLYLAILFLY